MLRRLTIIFFFYAVCITTVSAQKADLIREYIARYKDLAMTEMQRTGIPAAITLAQGIHESGAGNSELALRSNNHFGIKCKSNWTGETVRHDDDAKAECFRKYPSVEDSYRDHSDFLKNGTRYAFLFNLDPADYTGWAMGLKKAGYATNPKYPQVLVKLVEDYQLQEYTLLAMGKKDPGPLPVPVEKVSEKSTPGNSLDRSASDSTITAPATSPITTHKSDYPEGEFRINDTRVVFVKKGTSFLSIALQYKTDLARLFEFNERVPAETAETDQLVFLQRKRKTGDADWHLVQPGETLLLIAQQHGIRVECLQEFNWLKKEDRPAAGEKLYLRGRSTNTPRLALRENYSLSGGSAPAH